MTERKAIAKRTRDYPEETIELGLHTLALSGGNARKATKLLAARGKKVPPTTLRRWARESHAQRYREIYESELAGVRQRMAMASEEIAEHLTDLEWKVAHQVEKKLPDMSPEQAASALRNVTTSKGINIDKASALRGLPTEVRGESRDLSALLRALQQPKFKGVVSINQDLLGTAVEIPNDEGGDDGDDHE